MMGVSGGASCHSPYMCVHAVGPVSTGTQGLRELAANRRRRDADVFVRTRARVARTTASPAGAKRNDTKGHMTALNPTFAKLGVRDEIVRALAETGIEHPFAIQELTLPLALAGDDLIGQARTGMGKTLAFGVPLLHRIAGDTDRPLTGVPRALVVVPTRELCLQVAGDLAGAAKHLSAGDRPLSVVSIYGGRPYEPQIEALQAGADVVVGTPGRLLDLAQQNHLHLGGLTVLVLGPSDGEVHL